MKPSSPCCNSRVAPRHAMRPFGKARRVRIPPVFDRGATPPSGMQRVSNAARVAARAARTLVLFASCWLIAHNGAAQLTVTVTDINPDTSSLDATNPNGASGGRVNGIAVDRSNPTRVFAASEWGGIFLSTDSGQRWSHLPGHVPSATWDVAVDPTNSNRVYATSFYDGRTPARSGINVSTDGGNTWTHPATATPPANFCVAESRRTEPVAFGISIDPANANRVAIGTNCGVALSTNAGGSWTFLDPTPATRAGDVWDVVIHDGGIIDLCGDDGHQRTTDSGVTWTTATGTQPLQTGRCSLAVSPDEPYVLFAVVGTSIFESDDAGQSWPITYTNPAPQGRIPFVATNQRQGAGFDLWFGDVSVFRNGCTTPSPANPGGTRRCSTTFTNAQNGAHNDSGGIAFAPGTVDACPLFFSSDGGVFRNTVTTSPGCHTPTWDQPTLTPHALYSFAFGGANRAGAQPEDVYLGAQDDGSFGTTGAGAPTVVWTNEQCCDVHAIGGEAARGMSTVCCFNSGRATRMFLSAAGLGSPSQIGNYPAGNLRGFQHLATSLNFGANDYIVSTTAGVFVTLNIGAATITWTQLGAASTPAGACGLQVAFSGTTPTFFAKSGGCNGDLPGTLWQYQGTAGTGTWTQVPNPGTSGSFGIFGVDRNDPRHLIASHLGDPGGPRMVMTRDGGTTWTALPALDQMMTGAAAFSYTNTSGPTIVAGGASLQRNGYPQPTLAAFDPADPDIVVAAGADSGVFISTNGGARWQLVTDPSTPGTSGVPQVPRPYYAYFDHDPPGGDINLFLGTRGRGAWRLTFKKVDMPAITVPARPAFGASCAGETVRATLSVCNTSLGDLIVNSITSSNPQFSVTAPTGGFPLTISHDFCFPVEVTLAPTVAGTATTTFTIASNDPTFPSLAVPGTTSVGQPTAVTMIADTGKFGAFCAAPDAFKDLDLTVNNSGSCPLLISGVSSSAPPEFESPQVLVFPLKVAPGDSVAIPVRFHPSSAGNKTGTISVASNDPANPTKAVNVSGSAPPTYVCDPPVFAALDAAFGPTWGSGPSYTYSASASVVAPFGPGKRFGIQAQGAYAFYPGRQDGQLDATLLYRRGPLQFGAAGTFGAANVRAESIPGGLTDATLSLDVLLPGVRFGGFGTKGLRERDVVGRTELGALAGAPVIVTERLLHTIDQLGGNVQVPVLPDTWVDGHLEWLHRHAPGFGDTAGAGARLTHLLIPGMALTMQFDVNESYLSTGTVGTLTFGVTLGRKSRPSDYSNPVNPLGTMVPRAHYEVFPR